MAERRLVDTTTESTDVWKNTPDEPYGARPWANQMPSLESFGSLTYYDGYKPSLCFSLENWLGFASQWHQSTTMLLHLYGYMVVRLLIYKFVTLRLVRLLSTNLIRWACLVLQGRTIQQFNVHSWRLEKHLAGYFVKKHFSHLYMCSIVYQIKCTLQKCYLALLFIYEKNKWLYELNYDV